VDRAHEQRHGSHNFLLVSQPNTPGLKAIPGTRREAKALAEALQKDSFQTLHLDDREATLDNVKRAMMQHPWVHLACHAVQDTTSPLRSGFHLQDGLLDLSEIMKQQIPNADFAFLSACQTSAGDEKLSEEAVHLAAGMLAAGYRGVVSTMWSIKDNYGPDVAEEFYAYLCAQRAKAGEGKVGLSCAGAAYALDFATRHIREKVKDSEEGLLTWVPYVHFGQ
jgi:CHAT domain-containing protein